jgi:hypothetical protein
VRLDRAVVSGLNLLAAAASGAVAGAVAISTATSVGLRSDGVPLPNDQLDFGYEIAAMVCVAALVTLVPARAARFAGWPVAALGQLGLIWRFNSVDRLTVWGPDLVPFMVGAGLVLGGTMLALTARTADDEARSRAGRWLPIYAFALCFLFGSRIHVLGLQDSGGDLAIADWKLAVGAGICALAAVATAIWVRPARTRLTWGPAALTIALAALAYGLARALTHRPTTLDDEAIFLGYRDAANHGLIVAGIVTVVAAAFAFRVVGSPAARWLLLAPATAVMAELYPFQQFLESRLWQTVAVAAAIAVLVRYARRWVPWEAVALAVGAGAILLTLHFLSAAGGDNRDLGQILAAIWFIATWLVFPAGAAVTATDDPYLARGARRPLAAGDLVLGFAVLTIGAQQLFALAGGANSGMISMRKIAWWELAVAAVAGIAFGLEFLRRRGLANAATPEPPPGAPAGGAGSPAGTARSPVPDTAWAPTPDTAWAPPAADAPHHVTGGNPHHTPVADPAGVWLPTPDAPTATP